MSDTGSDEPERKRQRLEASDALVMDVNSSAKWDFLAPWCEELKDQLVSISGGLIRVLGPRRKREKPFRFNFEDDDDDEEEKVDPQEEEKEIEQALWRTREAIELLSLVAQVDQRAFHMLMTQHCGLQLEDEESEEEEEEFRPMIPGEVDDDFVFFEDDESDDGEEEGEEGEEDEVREQHEDNADDARADRGGQDAPGAVGSEIDADGTDTEREDDDAGPDERDGEDGNDDDEEEEHDDVFVLPPDSLNSERKRERETFISPQSNPWFDFISLRDIPGAPEVPGSLFAECEKLMLAEYQPSAAYMKAKKSILDMLPAERKVQQRIQRSLEIPVSLELTTWSKSADQLAGNVMELSSFMEAVSNRAQKLDLSAAKGLRDCASTFIYRLTQISMTLSHRGKRTDLLVDRLLEVLGRGVLVSELHMHLRDEVKTGVDPAIDHDILAKLLTGMVIRPLSPTQKQTPSFTSLSIDCNDSALWQFEALCSAFAVSQAPITKLTLMRACTYQMKDDQRRRCWKLLAQTFFHSSKRGPFSSVCALRLPDAELTLDDLAEITAVLQEKEYQATVAQQWNICQTQWLLRDGTAVQFTEQKGDERVLVSGDPLTLRQETLVILVESDADDTNDEAKSEWLDVIIPGYGQCRVPRDSAIAVPSEGSDSPVPPIGVPLASLSLSLKAEAGGLPGLIKQIGWSLEKLSLSFHRERRKTVHEAAGGSNDSPSEGSARALSASGGVC
ncbi:hypothetical protein ON010_g16233 [Phytophthora cinnamomi]|nr:hypothetical protein ON010_g16233 [Phytophthora cinnamomi]